MMVVFEVFLAPGADPETLLTEETKRSTKAQVMTVEDARNVGFAGLPDYGDKVVRLIAVGKVDSAWIHRALETSSAVARFSVNDVD
jgi:hypothetical protein